MEVKDYVFYSCAAPDHSIRMGISQEKETRTRTGLEGKVTGGIRQGTAGQADRAPEPGKPFSCTTFEVEISKVLRDCLIHCLAEGKCTPGDAWKAHGWLRAEFQDEFQEFVDDQEEWERRRYKLMKPDQDQ